MSKLLDDLIQQTCKAAEDYAECPHKAEALARQLAAHAPVDDGLPAVLHGKAEAAVIYRNLPDVFASAGSERKVAERAPLSADERLKLALGIDRAMREQVPAGWKGDEAKERAVRNVLYRFLEPDRDATRHLFDLVSNQPGHH